MWLSVWSFWPTLDQESPGSSPGGATEGPAAAQAMPGFLRWGTARQGLAAPGAQAHGLLTGAPA